MPDLGVAAQSVPYDWFRRSWWQTLIGVAPGVVFVAGAVAVAIDLAQAPEVQFKNPNFIDAILANRMVLALVRAALIVGAAYLVVSVVGHASQGRWLSGVGPFQIRDAARTMSEESSTLQRELRDAGQTIETLETRLLQTNEALQVSEQERDEAMRDLRKTEADLKTCREQRPAQ